MRALLLITFFATFVYYAQSACDVNKAADCSTSYNSCSGDASAAPEICNCVSDYRDCLVLSGCLNTTARDDTFVTACESSPCAKLLCELKLTQVTEPTDYHGEFRKFDVEKDNEEHPNGISVSGGKVELNGNGQAGSGTLDAAKFLFRNPASKDADQIQFYYGVLRASGNFDRSTNLASLSGALAEIAAVFDSVFVWSNNDDVAGFQYNLGNDFTDCTKSHDCILPTFTIQFKDLSWSPIYNSTEDCPAGYSADCKVYSLFTTGFNGTDEVVTFTLYLANQPVLVGENQISPDNSKIDITIKYPWTKVSIPNGVQPRVGLLAYGAGKAVRASYSGEIEEVTGNKAFTWEGNGYKTYFSWVGNALINGVTNGQVYVQGITSDQLKDFNCGVSCGLSSIYLGVLKTAANIYKAIGWDTQVVWFTWDNVKPNTVFWDPSLGSETQESSALALAMATPFTFMLFLILAVLL